MAFHNVLNNAGSTLTAAVATIDLTISVTADVFPAAPFYLTLGGNPSVYEIVEVTLKTGLVFTVGRAKDGTTAKTYVAGDLVQLFMTAGIVSELQTEVIAHEANTAPHGATATATANAIALRDASGNLTASSLVSNVASGTAPLIVTSPTAVTNLNVDMVDGFHASSSVVAGNMPVRNANGNVVSNLPVTGQNPNLVFNPSFNLGYAGWTSTGGVIQFGTNGEGSQLVVASPTQTTGGNIVGKSSLIPVVAGETFTLSTEMYTLGVTGGYAATQISYYDASGVQLASPVVGTSLSTGWKKYSVTAVAPANAVTVCALLFYSDLTSTGFIGWRKIKLEAGSISTTSSDDNTLNTSQYGGVLPLAQVLSGGNKKQTGSGAINITTAGTQAPIVVTFPISFNNTTPKVVLAITGVSVGDAGYISVRASVPTPTDITFVANSYTAQVLYFDWEATGT